MKKPVFAVFTLFLLLVLGWSRLAGADEVTTWNETAGQVAFDSGLSSTFTGNPVFESRIYAMTHAAIHDALNAIDRLPS
jgi:hypothetical protein